MKYRICEFIYQLLRKIAEKINNLSERFAICPDCGRNRYTGKPCVGEKE